jgi:hypothetical protein
MALPSGSSLDLSVDVIGPNISKTATDIDKLNAALQKNLKFQEQYAKAIAFEKEQVLALKTRLNELSIARKKGALTNAEEKDYQARKQSLSLWQENLKSSQANYTQASKNVSLLERHTQTLTAHNNKLQQMSSYTGMASQALNKFGMIFTRVLDALIAFKLIQWGSEIFQLFTTHIIDVNEQFEKLQVRLYNLNPDLEVVKKTWEEIKSVTVTSPFRIADVGQAAVMLKTFGVSAVQNLRIVSDWASAVEKDLEDVSVAFGKIVNRSPRTALMLSTRGLSMGGYEQYIAEYKDRATALQKYIDDTFGGTAARISETFYGLKTNIADLFDIMVAGKGEPVFKEIKKDLMYIQAILTEINETMGNAGIIPFLLSKIVPTSLLQTMAEDRLLKELNDLQGESSGDKNAKQILANLERQRTIVSLLEEGYINLGRLSWNVNVPTKEALSILEKEIEGQRGLVKLENEKLMMKNSRFSIEQRYELQKEITSKAPKLMTFLKDIKITDSTAVGQSAKIMLDSLTDSVSLNQLLAETKGNILAIATRQRAEDESEAAFAIRRNTDLEETIKEYLKLIDKVKKVHDYSQEIARLMERIADLTQKNSLARINMEQRKLQYGYSRGTVTADEYRISLENEYSQLDIKYKQAVAEKTQAEKLFNESGIARTGGKEEVDLYRKQLHIEEVEERRLGLWKEMADVIERIVNLPAPTFGEALNRQMLLLSKNLESIKDRMAQLFLDSVQDAGKGLLHEALFGTEKGKLDDQLVGLRDQLLQIQVEKSNLTDTQKQIYIVEDRERSLLAEINNLERERSAILMTILSQIGQKMVGRLEDEFINFALSGIGSLFGSSDTKQPPTSGGDVYGPDRFSPQKNINFYGDVYGTDEFKGHVEQAIHQLQRERI